MECKNNVCRKRTYKCAICGKAHESVYERMMCEAECYVKLEEEERKLAEEKRAAEKAVRKEAVDEAFENLHKLITEYVKDYGYYEYEDKNCHWPSKLWHNFIF